MTPDIKEKIIQELPLLPHTALLEISRIIDSFKQKARTDSSKGRFDDLFATISSEDAEEMLAAIADCDKIDANGW